MKRSTAVLLILGIIVAIVAESADFFFHRPYYEFWDLASNSLAVIRAKHFGELYGSYSRWGFHHPGPMFFYLQAFGEWLFYDCLHLTPAPFNAQTLINLCMTATFFVAALRSFAHWLDVPTRRWFIPAALAFGAMHFGAVSRMPSYDMLMGSSVFTSAWTAHSWVLPFLCLLVAGASVAAGRGQELPLLALADGFLVHAHIAAPLFVGPVTLLAYGGLAFATARHEAAKGIAPRLPGWQRFRQILGAARRTFPRQHVAALLILAVFALPLVIDLFLGDDSNFHAVLMHVRTHQGKHKTLARAFFYFAQFGAYRPYKAHLHILKKFDAPGAYAYVWYHKKIYLAWIAGLLVVIWAAVMRPGLMALRRRHLDGSSHATTGTGSDGFPDRGRFLAWAGAFFFLSVGLTLYWGIIQDGEMFYYSGWINFAIYYFGLLIVLAEVSAICVSNIRRWRNGALLSSPTWIWTGRCMPVAMVILACVLNADRFRVRDPAPETNRAMHESNVRIVRDANARNPEGTKIFDCPFFAWPAVTGVALEMEREGQRFMVVNGLNAEHFSVPFGSSHALRSISPADARVIELWRFKVGKLWKMWVSGLPRWYLPLSKALEQQLAVAQREKDSTGEVTLYPLLNHVELRIGVPIIHPKDETNLDFHKGGRGPDSTLYGFSDPEKWGTWNFGTSGALRLRGAMVDPSDNVEISLDTHPYIEPNASLTSQRLSVAVNGTLLGREARLTEDNTVVYVVPGPCWNQTFGKSAGASLEFGFPDSAVPARVNPDGGNDARPLGVGFYGISFRTVRAIHSDPQLDLTGTAQQAEMDFRPAGNAATFAGEGWYESEKWGAWSRGHWSTLRFHSKPILGTHEVEITLDIRSIMTTDSAIKGQRLRASLGDTPFDYERTLETPGSLVLRMPATVWNWYVANDAEAMLQLEFPDAVSPARLDRTGSERDERMLAVGIERIRFRDVPVPMVTGR